MAVGLNSPLSNLLLNPYTQQTYAALQQARDVSADAFRPGSTITARYTLDDEGALQLRDLEVVDATADSTSEQAGQQRQRTLAEQQGREGTLAGLSRPRAVLNPSDEVALFAADDLPTDTAQLTGPRGAYRNGLQAGITEIGFDDAPTARELSTAAQQQVKVAGLYARNADITFTVDPVYSQAA